MSLLIFDVDGVLGNFEQLKKMRDQAHILAVAKKRNLAINEAESLFFQTKEKLKPEGKHSTLDTMSHLGISKKEFFQIMNSVEVQGNIIPTPNVQETLSTLSKKHTIVALTNTPHQAMVKTLNCLGVSSLINKIYSIDQYNYVKPSTKIFGIILQDFPQRPVYSIGDSIEKDLVPAKQMGVKTILFGTTNKQEGVDFVIIDFKEIPEIIEKNGP